MSEVKIDWDEVRLLSARLSALGEEIEDTASQRARDGEYVGHTMLQARTAERCERAAQALFSVASAVGAHLHDTEADQATERDWSPAAVAGERTVPVEETVLGEGS